MSRAAFWIASWVSFAALAGVTPMDVRKSEQCLPPQWEAVLWPKMETVTFRPTTIEERKVFEELIPAMLEAAPQGGALKKEWQARADAGGFLVEAWQTPRDLFWVIRERPDRYHGAGAYVIRTGAASNDFIQAPHAYFDTGTGKLGSQLFACPPDGTRPRLFATNTSHRFRSRPGEQRDDPDHPADVAHNPDHLFTLVTDLAAQKLPGLRVLQIHGFARASTTARSELLAVVSDGSRAPAPATRKLAARLGSMLGQGVRLYPDETEILGATRNAQARLLQSHPGTSFVHVELSAEARQSLANPGQMARLGDALLAPFEG